MNEDPIEACPKPIKVYLPGPKTITLGTGATLPVYFDSWLWSLSISVGRCSFVSCAPREIGCGPLIFAAKVVSNSIQLCVSIVIMDLIRQPDTLGRSVETCVSI